MNKQVNKKKSSDWKSLNLGYHNGGTCNVWVQTKHQRTYKKI